MKIALTEIRRVLPLLLLAVVCGIALGNLGWWVAGAMALYAAWSINQLQKLHGWLSASRVDALPDAPGLWGEVFTKLHHRERRVKDRRRQLSKLLDQFQRATQAMPDGVVILTATGEISAFNKAGRTLLGLRQPDDYGRPIANYLRMPEVSSFIEAAEPEETIIIDSPLRRGVSLMLQVIPYSNTGQRLLIARDVTRVQRLERVREDFVANVSHELKSPLTVVRGYAEHLQRLADEGNFESLEPRTRETLQQSLVQVQAESDRMRSLVDDLLELARLEAADADGIKDVTDIDVDALIDRVVSDARNLNADAHRIVLDVDTSLSVLGNEREIYTAFSNIVFNAVRYTPEDSEVRITWALEGEEPVFTVQDNGPGIPADDIPRLTERFYRVDTGRSRSAGGTGLGLAIAKHVMLRHDGQIDIESEVGKGTTMTCRFAAERTRRTGTNVVSLASA